MKDIAVWFKGNSLHDGSERGIWMEQGPGEVDCLLTACDSEGREQLELAAILRRLFPERVCSCEYAVPQLIHFNNDPRTTRDEIDKIMHTWHLEYGG